MDTMSALLTDYYQFTMAYGYWQLNRAEQEAVFQLTFRKNPFQGNYTVACGLASVIDYLKNYHFTDSDIAYLKSLKTTNNKPAFTNEFLSYLAKLKFTCDIDAIPEGTIVFPQEPLLRIRGPILQCQLLETPLINLINFSTLVATRASQFYQAAQADPIIEFGLRRSQGPNGGLTASRAAYIGGCESVSNVLAGKLFNIPVVGTQAHSWIMSYSDELTAFKEFVKVIDTTVLLVDTYDSIRGIKNAILVGQELRKHGRDLAAIRLDSGDLLSLSRKARKLLNDAGFTKTKILASGDLSIEKIAKLKAKQAPIDIWGVGTKLVTAYEQPSLDAIYKLTAIKEKNAWQYKMKISDAPNKMTWPGLHQVRRYFQKQKFVEDVIYDIELGITDKLPRKADRGEDLLIPIFRHGKLVYQQPDIQNMREKCIKQVSCFATDLKRKYSVRLAPSLSILRNKLKKILT